jgi:hypothetical protein
VIRQAPSARVLVLVVLVLGAVACSKDGGSSSSSGGSIPAGFPKQFPLPASYQVVNSQASGSGDAMRFRITLQVPQALDQVDLFFRTQLDKRSLGGGQEGQVTDTYSYINVGWSDPDPNSTGGILGPAYIRDWGGSVELHGKAGSAPTEVDIVLTSTPR